MSASVAAPTPGAISAMFRSSSSPKSAVVQITDFKYMPSPEGAPKRIKVQMSDGELWALGIVTSDCAGLFASEAVVLNQLVTLKEYLINAASGQKVCVIMQMAPVAVEEGAELTKIGEPIKWDSAEAAALAPAIEVPSASPKGGVPQHESPKTGNAASRTNPSSFAPRPPQAAPSEPLVAARSQAIEQLNPYMNRWQIKVRVMSKGDLRTYSSAKGDGSVFSCDLADESGEIRATAWREVADRLYHSMEVGQTYLISRGRLQPANKRFNTLNNHYEITFSFDTQIQHCPDVQTKIKTHYNFCKIGEIANRPAGATVDIIGVVSNVSGATSITSTKTGKELTKRTMQIADDSGKAIELTIWGNNAQAFPDDGAEAQVIAFKGMRVTEWNQRSLGSGQSSTFEINPELEQTEKLKAWWEGGASVESLSVDTRGGGEGGGGANRDERSTVEDFVQKGDELSGGAAPVYASMRAYFSKVMTGGGQGAEERALWYGACPKCNKKAIGDDASGFNCENCGWSGPECNYRYILPLMTLDATGHSYMTAFSEIATQILGTDANSLKRLKDNDLAQYEAVLAQATWKPYLLRVRGKMETYQDKSRLKSHVLSAAPINWAGETKLLLADIAKYGNLSPVKPEADDY